MKGFSNVTIIGAGLAALRCAERLRERGYDRAIIVFGDEPAGPYNRTPLSKQLLAGEMHPDQLRFQTSTDLADVTWRLGTRVAGIDRSRAVVLADGTRHAFGGLVVATGVKPRTITGAHQLADRVFVLRTLDDCRRLDLALATADSLAIIGGGFIGCEVATSARKRGVPVIMIDISMTLLSHAIGPELGQIMTDIHRENGVDVRAGIGVARIERERGDDRIVITLANGTRIRADVVLVGVGTAPRVEGLHGFGLDLSDGVLCGPTCHVAGLPDVVAAGDVARWPNLAFDDTPRRVEHWINAVEQARHAADALLEGIDNAQSFTPIPRFWSEQHGTKVQSIGMPRLGTTITISEGSVTDRQLVATYTNPAGRLVGAVAINAPRALLAYADRVTALPKRRTTDRGPQLANSR